MESIRIDIINPKAKRLLMNLADLNLIRINKENVQSEIQVLLDRLRANSEDSPSIEEISKEVEAVRKDR